MAFTKAYTFSMPTLSERVTGIQRLIDAQLEELRLKKQGELVYLRMFISDNPEGYPNLETKLQYAYEIVGWQVSFAYSPEGTEIILS